MVCGRVYWSKFKEVTKGTYANVKSRNLARSNGARMGHPVLQQQYDEMVNFEWDPGKARQNRRKHRVSFQEAASVFGDPLAITSSGP